MKCPKCNKKMKLRDGEFGEFYFCENQRKCGQKTISKDRREDDELAWLPCKFQ